MDSMLLSEMVSVTCHATMLHYTVLCVVTLVSYHHRKTYHQGWGTPLVCAAPKGRVFALFWSEKGYRLCPFWSGIWCSFRGN